MLAATRYPRGGEHRDGGRANPAGGARLGHELFRFTATDSYGQMVTAFDQPLELIIRLSPDELQSIRDDLMALVVSVADPATGVVTDLPTTVQPDGAVTLSLDPFGSTEESAEPVPSSDPAVDGEPIDAP